MTLLHPECLDVVIQSSRLLHWLHNPASLPWVFGLLVGEVALHTLVVLWLIMRSVDAIAWGGARLRHLWRWAHVQRLDPAVKVRQVWAGSAWWIPPGKVWLYHGGVVRPRLVTRVRLWGVRRMLRAARQEVDHG